MGLDLLTTHCIPALRTVKAATLLIPDIVDTRTVQLYTSSGSHLRYLAQQSQTQAVILAAMEISPFRVDVPEEEVARLKRKLQDTRVPTHPIVPEAGGDYGLSPLGSLVPPPHTCQVHQSNGSVGYIPNGSTTSTGTVCNNILTGIIIT